MLADPEAETLGAEIDRVYRYQRHIYDATRKFYLIGRDRMIDRLDPPRGGAVLEVGCGTGRNLVKIARAYPDARVYGLDISREMLKSARGAIRRSGLSHRITLARGSADRFEAERLFGVGSFDRIVFSYALSMMPPWRTAVREALRHLAPGGSLHVVDFGQQDGWPDWFRNWLFGQLARMTVHPRHDLVDDLRAAAAGSGAGVQVTPLRRGYALLADVRKPHTRGVRMAR